MSTKGELIEEAVTKASQAIDTNLKLVGILATQTINSTDLTDSTNFTDSTDLIAETEGSAGRQQSCRNIDIEKSYTCSIEATQLIQSIFTVQQHFQQN
jgi:hypothetical protein